MSDEIYLLQSSRVSEMAGASEWMTPLERLAFADWVRFGTVEGRRGVLLEGGGWFSESNDCDMPDPVERSRTLELADAARMIDGRCSIDIVVRNAQGWSQVVDTIHESVYLHGHSYRDFMISSPVYSVLRAVRRCDHHIRTQLITEDTPLYSPSLATEFGVWAVQVPMTWANREIADACHEQGLVVIAGGVHDTVHMDQMHAAGVDGVLTRNHSGFLRWHAAQRTAGEISRRARAGVCQVY